MPTEDQPNHSVPVKKVKSAWQTYPGNAGSFKIVDGVRYELRPFTYDDEAELDEREGQEDESDRPGDNASAPDELLAAIQRVVDHLAETWERQADCSCGDPWCEELLGATWRLLELHKNAGAES
jgi:hypothetical protein